MNKLNFKINSIVASIALLLAGPSFAAELVFKKPIRQLQVSETPAPQGVLSLSTSSLSFTSTNVGATSSPLSALIQNTGNAPLSMLALPSLAGGSSAAFSNFYTNCSVTTPLGAGENCYVSIQFSPTSTVTQSGSISISTSLGNASVSLAGTGIGVPEVSYSSNGPLSFGSVNVGQSSASQTYTVTSTGTASLSITNAPSITGTDASMFAISNNTCTAGASLAPNATCSFDITFSPTSVKTASASLSVVSALGTKNVSLSGIGNAIPLVGSGGTLTVSGGYAYHTFTGNGTFTITQAPSSGGIEVLVVGGGGGGAGGGTQVGGGGGGAGGVVVSSQSITATGSISVVVGAGGLGKPANVVGTMGGSSSVSGSGLITTVTALGGGGGGNNSGTAGAATTGVVGSGGGTSCNLGSNNATSVAGLGTPGQGNNGSNASGGRYGYTACNGGGGGGYGSAGLQSSAGGTGYVASNFLGATYAQGGAGGFTSGGAASNAAANTGNGGAGGGGNNVGTAGGNGGSGIVIIRYPTGN